jgi:hypothetical protein
MSRNKSKDNRDNRDKSMDLREKTKERLKYKNDLEELSTTIQTIKPKDMNLNQVSISNLIIFLFSWIFSNQNQKLLKIINNQIMLIQ